MNETHYLEIGSQASDCFLELLGADDEYLANGYSFFTVENHLRYLREVHTGERITITTQVLEGQGKKLKLFHSFHNGEGENVATMESLLLHMDMKARRSCSPVGEVAERIKDFADSHAQFTVPEAAGRFVGAV